MEEIIKDTDLVSCVKDYKFIYRKDFERKEAQKDVEVYKKSTVNIGKYIFVQTIRLMAYEAKYMINNTNLDIFTKYWYERYIGEVI